MTHRIDVDGIRRNLFILLNLAYASKPFCTEARINRTDDGKKSFGWTYYIGWLKSTVSEILIETAIKYRILHDLLKNEDLEQIDLNDLDRRSLNGMIVGRFLPSMESMPIREVCNKIIHAEEVMLTWIERQKDKKSFEYWNGDIHLHGHKGNEFWDCELYIVNFCIAFERALAILETEVEWDDFYKFDE